MGKVRVHELAKKLNMTNQELMAKLHAKGLVVKTHSSSVDEAQVMALLQSVESQKEQLEARPRTVLRRRKPEEEIKEEAKDVLTEETRVALEEPIETQSKPVVMEQQSSESGSVGNVEPVSPREIQVQKEDMGTSVERSELAEQKQALEATPQAGHNVVRVIDPSAIKARLAAEGRRFGPRQPPVRRPMGSGETTGAAHPSQRGIPPKVREFKVVHSAAGAPQMVDVSSGAGKPGSARPSKWKEQPKSTDKLSFKERRELHGGGHELWSDARGKRKQGKKEKGVAQVTAQSAAHKRVVELSGPISVNELAHRMSVKAGQVVAKLMGMGMMVTVNQSIEPDVAAIVASEFEYEVKNVAFVEEDILKDDSDGPGVSESRPPVVAVMGHVDHGKTSLLDVIRQSNVAASEAGGITQHIGAYSVQTHHGEITFLDTPGHSAFTAMRARGAKVTDMVILVVAADDGIMPQTIEAINHAKAASVPVVVAINKIDKPDAKPERVMQQLSEFGLVPEAWGGDTLMFPVSALKNQGVQEMLDGIAVQAEMMELKGNPQRRAKGTVVEAKLDKGRGPVATVLIQAGTLSEGDSIVAGEFSGRVRAMYDSSGGRLNQAGLSKAIQILGLDGVPTAGDVFHVVQDDKMAKTVAQHRSQKRREQELVSSARVTLENFLTSSPADSVHELRLIVKADVFGSVEALVAALRNLSTKEVKVEVIHSGVGTITENDVNLAVASKAIIIGFNIKPDAKAQGLAAQEKVDVRSYSIIYEMLDEVRMAMAGLLAPVTEENYLGKAEVRAIFPSGKALVAGCYVLEGKILRSAKVRVKRNNQVVHEGNIHSLKRFKDDVREVAAGYECGLMLEGFKEITVGDVVECFELKQVAAKLGEALSDQSSSKAAKQASV